MVTYMISWFRSKRLTLQQIVLHAEDVGIKEQHCFVLEQYYSLYCLIK